MKLAPTLVSLCVASLLAVPLAEAQRAGRARVKPAASRDARAKAKPTKARKPTSLAKAKQKRETKIAKAYLEKRTAARRMRSKFFKKITVDKNYKNEYVFHRTKTVTAFLDMSDPQHPGYDPKQQTGEDHILKKIPRNRRAHVLVVPNQPREHLTQNLNAPITAKDLKTTLQVVKSAERLAAKIGIKNPQIYVNPESRISIGYLHVHIVGEKPNTSPYPAALK